jgi:hypothetical protein
MSTKDKPRLLIEGGHALTTSLAVADYFSLPHQEVLRHMNKLLGGMEPSIGAMVFSPRPDGTLDMGHYGFTLLAPCLTGPIALELKIRYLASFILMRDAPLPKHQREPMPFGTALIEALMPEFGGNFGFKDALSVHRRIGDDPNCWAYAQAVKEMSQMSRAMTEAKASAFGLQ